MSSITIVDIPRISRESLAGLIKDKHPSMAVIDVRDSDYIGGHIAGGTNIPSNTHDYKMPELVRTLKDKETVVFHCALSQQRGPSAALRYLRVRERLSPAKEGEVKMVEEVEGEKVPESKGQTVYVLDGGFVKWQELYGEDKELTEGYEKDIWEFGY
ncbi:Rhodanese-like protein [Aureobasidium pullulans]|uniref:Rhodanese-like protein n=1 Tax=Aureobasidium pullulans TaxID=5580 RepID=A0A4T0BK19_AURPU|nr:Rhodanese-like protein [Aureobasidium pullulans]